VLLPESLFELVLVNRMAYTLPYGACAVLFMFMCCCGGVVLDSILLSYVIILCSL
jgi:hypothetical protein